MTSEELTKVRKNKIGRVKTNGMHKEAHEYETALYLALFGLEIEFIVETYTKGTHNADFLMLGTIWEAKSPNGSSKHSIERNFHAAGHQSSCLILDLRRFKLPADRSETEAIKQFKLSRNIRRMILITKDGRVLDFKK